MFFVSQLGTLPENDLPIHTRWELILTWHPDARKRYLFDDMSDIYADMLANGSGSRLITAFDLSCLQSQFWGTCWENRMVPVHVMQLQTEQCMQWQKKLASRINETKPHRRSGYRIKNEVVPPPPSKYYPWLN